MKLTFAASDLQLAEADRQSFEQQLRPVEALVADEPRARLHVLAARERRGDHRVSLSLDLPKRFLFATESHRSLASAFRLACESLIRKLGRYRERRERARARRTPVRVEEAPLAAAAARGDFDAFRDNIREHLDRLRTVIRWELHHDARSTRLVRARISVEDLAEEVLADIFDRFAEKPAALTAEQWMVRRALETLDERIRETLREPREQQQRTEEEEEGGRSFPEEHHDEYERLQSWFPDLYGAGEPTPLDRLAAGEGASPDRALEAEEQEASLSEALAALPRDWRRSFTLHHLEGYDPAAIAELLETSEDQVLQDLESALGFLRARLR